MKIFLRKSCSERAGFGDFWRVERVLRRDFVDMMDACLK